MALALTFGLFANADTASAQTLDDAFERAYRLSPELEAERARLKATDEDIDLAWTGYNPVVRAELIAGRRRTEAKLEGDAAGAPTLNADGAASFLDSSAQTGTTSPRGYQITGQQPIFDGFKTKSAVGKAEANSRAGQADLVAAEARVLLKVARTYLEAIRNQEHVAAQRRSVEALRRELASVSRRRASQEATNADHAATRARLAAAEAELAEAEANLEVSIVDLTGLMGERPQALRPPRRLQMGSLPRTLDEALAIARTENPTILAARGLEEAASFNITEVRSELLPKVSLEGSWSDATDPSRGISSASEGIVYGRVSVPIFEGGGTYVRLRQAKHEQLARTEDMRRALTSVETEVTTAWRRREAAAAQLGASITRKRASAEALAALRREMTVNARTQSEVLDAEREVAEADIAVASARAAEEIANYTLLAAIGRLTLAGLGSEGTYSAALVSAEHEPESDLKVVAKAPERLKPTVPTDAVVSIYGNPPGTIPRLRPTMPDDESRTAAAEDGTGVLLRGSLPR